MENRGLKGMVRGIMAAALLAAATATAGATEPAVAMTPAQEAFETFFGSNTADQNGFYNNFYSSGTPQMAALADHLAGQLAPALTGNRRTYLVGQLLARLNAVSGPNYNDHPSIREQYVLTTILYGLGRPAGAAVPPLNTIPVRTDAERAAFLARLTESYNHYLDLLDIRVPGSATAWRDYPPMAHVGFLTELARDLHYTGERAPGTASWIVRVDQRNDGPSPFSLLAPFASGRTVGSATAGGNPFSPVRLPPPPPILTTSPEGGPVLDFARLGAAGSGYSWQSVAVDGGRTQRVLTQQIDGAPVEVGRVWSQGGFNYLNYTGPNGNPQDYGHVFALGANGALPAGQASALPPGVDYSRIQTQTVTDVTGGRSQVVLLPTGSGFQDLAGNTYAASTRYEPVYTACGRFGRQTCVSHRATQEIRPTAAAAPPERLSLPAAGAAPTAGQYALVTQDQPNQWGSRRILQRNGQPVGYVISVGGQDVIFMGSPTSTRWAIYGMDGRPITLTYSGQPFVNHNFRDSRGESHTLALIHTGGSNYVTAAGITYEAHNGGYRRTGGL
ncbi:MAG: hypothetical protein HYZ75_09965 [Elusimicrobia bacterium]|nr:hypothetical protein [Elusimicrobiota bacterium]